MRLTKYFTPLKLHFLTIKHAPADIMDNITNDAVMEGILYSMTDGMNLVKEWNQGSYMNISEWVVIWYGSEVDHPNSMYELVLF